VRVTSGPTNVGLFGLVDLFGLFGIVVLACAAGACATTPKPKPKPTLQLSIQAEADTNYGGPLYMVVRKTDREAFLAEGYDALAGAVFGKDDPSVLRKEVIWPRDKREVRIEKEKEEDVLGVYFFYTTPGKSWRFAVLDPAVKRMNVRLGSNEIKQVEPAR
jgi:predicted component of type VI protein secretion system